MSQPPDSPSGAPRPPEVLAALHAWQRGEGSRDTLTGHLTRLGGEQGEVVQAVIGACLQQAREQPPAEALDRSPDDWRAELLACRARAWAAPASAGLLVGPSVLILTDGRQGVVLSASGTRPLKGGVSASLLLLSQTIVMADDAVDARELGRLREQRTEASSTSLSEIRPIR